MRFIRIEYYIAWIHFAFGPTKRPVSGYAFEHGKHQLCARKESSKGWVVDHYLTGFAIARGGTREEAVFNACEMLDNRPDTNEKIDSAFALLRERGLIAC